MELSQSEKYLNKAIGTNTEYIGNRVHMEEFYKQKAGNRESFHALLIDVVQSDPTLHPGIIAENIFYQKRTQLLLSKEPSLFE